MVHVDAEELKFHPDISFDNFIKELKMVHFDMIFPGANVFTRGYLYKHPCFVIENNETKKHSMFFVIYKSGSSHLILKLYSHYQKVRNDFSSETYLKKLCDLIKSLVKSYFKNPRNRKERIKG